MATERIDHGGYGGRFLVLSLGASASRRFLPSCRLAISSSILLLGNVERGVYSTLFKHKSEALVAKLCFLFLHRLLRNLMKTQRRLPRISAHLLLHCDLDLFNLHRRNQRRG